MKTKLVVVLLLFTLILTACTSPATSNEPPQASVDEATVAPAEAAEASASEAADVPTTDSTVHATVLWRAFDDQYQSGFRVIMEDEAEKLGGFDIDMQDGENDASKMTNKLEASLSKGTDVIAAIAVNSESTQSLMEKVKADDVPIVFFNTIPSEETMNGYDKIWYVGADPKESGVMCAQALINYWNNNTEIADKNGDGILQLAILQGEIGHNDVILRTEAYEETLKAQGIEYEIVAMDTANWDKGQALDKLNAWIAAYGIDGIEGVLANNDGMAMGAVQAALNNDYNTGDPEKFLPVVGIDATLEALEAMKDGSLLGTVLNDRQNQSIAVLNIMKAAVDGVEVTSDVLGVDGVIDGKYVWIPYQIVDETNLDSTLELMLSTQ